MFDGSKHRSPDWTEASKWHLRHPCDFRKEWMALDGDMSQIDVLSACTAPERPADALISLEKYADQQRARSLRTSSLSVWRLLRPILGPIYLAEARRNPPRYLPLPAVTVKKYKKKTLLYGWSHAVIGFHGEGHRNQTPVDQVGW